MFFNEKTINGMCLDKVNDNFEFFNIRVNQRLLGKFINQASSKILIFVRKYQKLSVFIAEVTGILEEIFLILLFILSIIERQAIAHKLVKNMLKIKGSKNFEVEYFLSVFKRVKMNEKVKKLLNINSHYQIKKESLINNHHCLIRNKKIFEDKSNSERENQLSVNSDNDKVFMFPPKEDISSRIEFPFSFQQNSILNSNDIDLNSSNSSGNINNLNNLHQLSSLIKMENTPVLYLDISDEDHQNKLILESLVNENKNLDKTLEQKQNNLMNFKKENELLLTELNKLKNDLMLKSQEINILTESKAQEENKFICQRQLNQAQIEQKDIAIQSLLINLKQLEKDINNNNKENKERNNEDKFNEKNINDKDTNYSDNLSNIEQKEKEINNKQFKYLEKKFSEEKYTDNEVINLLTTDLYDFYHYNKMIYDNRIQEINKMLTILKKLLDIEAEIKLYGSYATKTSLIWSEIDLLIIPSVNDLNFSENNIYGNFIQRLCHKLQSSNLNVAYIEDLQVITPIIKIEVGEPSLIYNIFVLDNTNFNEIKNLEDNSLIKSIILTNEYSTKYKGKFIPLLLGLKQLLYSANLIDNYYCNRNNEINVDNINLNLNPNESYKRGISSYALNIMLMAFLDSYNYILDEIPLGQIFIDFLKMYGYLMHENSNKRIIYLDYDNNGQRDKLEEIKYNNENGIEKLIIVDPFNIRNNLTEKIMTISQFEITFKIAFTVIKDNCECSCHYNEEGNYQGKIHCILNKIFKTVKRFSSIRKDK